MVKFRYSPLPDVKHIRFLTLSPGDPQDELHLELNITLLSIGKHYEALSYFWGSPMLEVKVTVGVSANRYLLVTQNLATALRNLRHLHEPRVLWVDAVCIDQSSTAEQSSQVAMMSKIYQLATKVIVWLGPEDNDSARALDVLEAFGSTIDVDWINYSKTPKALNLDEPSNCDSQTPTFPMRAMDIQALYHLFLRPWFERLWVRQEIGLATEALIVCGTRVLPWQTFRTAIFGIHIESDQLVRDLGNRGRQFRDRLRLIYAICDHKIYLLDSLRTELSHVKCTDPKDRIYAVLALLHPSHREMGIVPKYSLTTAQVYEEATLRFVEYWNSLAILFQCELQESSPVMPSWVPDWSTELLANPISGSPSNASVYLEAVTTYKGNGVLSVGGLCAATIQHVQPMHVDEDLEDFENMLRAIWDVMAPFDANGIYPRGESRLEIFCDTICCGLFRHTTSPVREDFADFGSSVRALASILNKESAATMYPGWKVEWEKYTRRVRDVCQNRAFFLTSRGLIGLAPLSAMQGDEVCVLLGCDSTMVLRPTGNNLYQVVGQSYMSGINTGEALLGRLPQNLRAVNYYDNMAQTFYFAYMNDQTGKVQFEDPRLRRLPIDLEFHQKLWQQGNFQRVKVGMNALREAGIDVKYFDLV